MDGLWDSPGWKQAVHDSGFSKEARNIALAMSADGVNPFKGVQHSMWPILFLVRVERFTRYRRCSFRSHCVLRCTVQNLNLDESARLLPENLLLFGVVPGPDAPSTLKPYLDLAVDELLALHEGVPAVDVDVKEQSFMLHARLLFTMADYPGAAPDLATSLVADSFSCRLPAFWLVARRPRKAALAAGAERLHGMHEVHEQGQLLRRNPAHDVPGLPAVAACGPC